MGNHGVFTLAQFSFNKVELYVVCGRCGSFRRPGAWANRAPALVPATELTSKDLRTDRSREMRDELSQRVHDWCSCAGAFGQTITDGDSDHNL